jgi:uncharacterized protein
MPIDTAYTIHPRWPRGRAVARARRLGHTVTVMCALLALAGVSTADLKAGENAYITPSHAAAVVALLDTMGVFASARTEAHAMVARLRADNPKIPVEVWTSFEKRISGRRTLEDTYVPIYAKYLPEEEARGVVSFYQTPAGARFLELNPRIEAQARGAAQAWAVQLAQELLTGAAVHPSPAPASSLDPAGGRIGAIEELLRESGTLVTARQMMLDILDRLQHGSEGDMLPPAFWDGARKRLGDDEELLKLWTPAYAHFLSDADVNELIRFYRGPVGARFVAALPAIQQESVEAAEQLGHEAARGAIREVLGPLPQWALSHPHRPASHSSSAASLSAHAGSSEAPQP